MKKLSSAIVGASMAFSLVLAGVAAPAQAVSVEELQAQINALLAQLSSLQGGSSSSSSAASCVQFNANLTLGSQGADVVNLQSMLEGKGFLTIPAGVSKGYFGGLTKSALASYQASAGIFPAVGYFGPITRAHFNGMPCGSSSTTSTSSDSSSSEDSSSDDGGFVASFEGDGEASIENFDVEDPSDTDIEEGQQNAVIATFDFEVEEADVKLRRVDVAVETQDSAVEDDPWQVFDSISIWYDGEKLAEKAADDEDDWENEDYDNDSTTDWRLRISGVNEVLMEGDHEVEIRADIQDGLDGVDSGSQQEWDIFVPNQGTDGAEFLSPNGALESEGSNTDRASITLDEEGGDTELEVSLGSSNPDSTTIEVERDSNSDEVTVLTFDVKAEQGSVEINELQFVVDLVNGDGSAVTNATTTFTDIIDEIFVVGDGVSEDFEEASASSEITDTDGDGTDDSRTTITFDLQDNNEEIELDEEEEKTYEIQVRFNGQDNNYTQGTTVKIAARSSDVDAWDVESGRNDLVAADKNGSAIGDEHQLLEEGVNVEFVDSSASTQDNDSGQAVKTIFEVKVAVSAFGDTFFIPFGATTTADVDGITYSVEDPNTNDAHASFVSSAVVAEILTSTADREDDGSGNDFYRIDSGDTETFTVRVELDSDSGAFTGAHRIQLNTIQFTDEVGGTTTPFEFLPEEDYESDSATLDA